ncbi:MAG: DinB family protein, partial [Longimicrobiales bacterium]
MQRRRWFDREFPSGMPPDAVPELVERLRGTPARAEERLAQVPPDRVARRVEGGWSPLEHVGHMADLEALWIGRLDDLAAGAALRPADLENTATWDADHNRTEPGAVLDRLRTERVRLLARIAALGPSDLQGTSRHPRLGTD